METRKHGTLILKVKREGAEAFGILQTIAYDDATPRTYREALKEIEGRRNGWAWNYDAFRNAQFEIEDKETGAADVLPASEATRKGRKASAEDFHAEAETLERRLRNARKQMNALKGKRGFGDWRQFVRELERDLRDLNSRFPQFSGKGAA